MLTEKVIKSMPKVEMVRCEVTGKLFPVNECEVVVIKIIKSKDSDINNYTLFKEEPVFKNSPVKYKEERTEPAAPAVPGAGTPEYEKSVHTAHSIIPPQFRDLFSDPSKP